MLKYERWLRQTDRLDILPPLMAIGWSRSETTTPLESFRLCFKRSDIKWGMLELDSGPDVQNFEALDIPQLKPFQGFSSFFKSCVTATATSVMVHTDNTIPGLPRYLRHTLPIFEPYFCQMSVLKIDGSLGSTFDILPNFFRLEELQLSLVHIPVKSTNAGLPIFQTLLRLSLDYMDVTWMDGCVFTKLKRLSLDKVSFARTLSVGLPVCTHMKYVAEDDSLLRFFRVPTLIELVKYDHPSLKSDNTLRLLPTRRLLLRNYHYTPPETLVAGIASLVELEDLTIEVDQRNLPMALLTALGTTIAKIAVPALRSDYDTLGRNNDAKDDEYGEDASTWSIGPRSLICPNLRQLVLRIWSASATKRQAIEQECKQMMNSRRRADRELECCHIWWDLDATPLIVLGTPGRGLEVV